MSRMKRAFVYLSASVGLLAACSDLNETDFIEKDACDGDLVESVIFEVPVIYAAEETRASLSQEGDAAIHFGWESTDTVGIFPNKGSQVYFEVTDGVGTNSAHFDGGAWALRQESTYSCYYPFVCDMKLKRDAIPVSFTGQAQNGVSTYSNIRFVLASKGTSSSSGSLHFTFQMLNTIFRIKAIGLPAGTYTKLTLEAEDPVFVQEGTFGLDDLKISGKTYSNTLELSLKDVVLKEASTETDPLLFYLSAAPVDLSGKTVTVRIYSEDGEIYQCEKKPINSAAGSWTSWKCEMKATSTAYSKVSSISVDETYLIVDADDGKLFKGASDGSYMAVSPKNDVIIDTDGSLEGYEFTVESDGGRYYLKFNDGKYLVCNYSGNSLSGLAYVNTRSDVTYPYALSTGNNDAFYFSTTQVNSTSETNQVLYFKNADNVFKIGGSGRTIGVHLYMKNGKQNRGLSFNPESVTCTLEDIPEKPVLSGTYTTVNYSSGDESIAKVDADGNVTPVAPGIVTITATAAEDDQYSAATASYTLRILSAMPGGWVALETFNLENQALHDYLDDAIASYSDTDDETNTVMSTYCGPAYSSIERKDCPAPVTIHWTNSASESTVIRIYEDQTLSDPVWSQNATERSTSADVYNLIPGRTYYYTVSENSTVWEKGYFNTTGRRRMIKVSDKMATGHANNCRDLGGLEVTDNGTQKTIKYGYLFRGTNMDKTTDTEKSILTDFLNIKMDVDLRSGSSSGVGMGENGSSNCYQPFAASSVGYIHPGFNSFTDLTTDSKIQSVLTAIFNTAKSGKATYFHCYIGADRTGYIAMLIEGLLGVSEKDCSIDYELTSFSKAAEERYRTGKPRDYYFRQGIAFLRGQAGNTFQEKVENYLVNTVKISKTDIEEFKSIVLE